MEDSIMGTLLKLVEEQCCNLVGGKCLGVDLFGKRFKNEESTIIIYQYPYEFEYKNSGDCWIKENKPCDFFKKCVLPLAPELSEKYRKIDSSIKEAKRCSNCGNKIGNNERKCTICKRKARRLRNRKFRGV